MQVIAVATVLVVLLVIASWSGWFLWPLIIGVPLLFYMVTRFQLGRRKRVAQEQFVQDLRALYN